MGRLTAVLVFGAYVLLYAPVHVLACQASPKQDAPAEQKGAGHNLPLQSPTLQPAAVSTTSESPWDRFQNFSAIQNGGPLPGMDDDRFIYRSGKLVRVQGDASVPEYYITNLITQQSHAVESNGCLEMGYPYKGSFPFFAAVQGVTYEFTPIGEENVDGHRCHVEDVVIHSPKNPVVLHFRLYEADDLQGFPIKIENRRENAYPWVIRYKDVRLGPQDPSLFMIPNKCQTMAGFKKVRPGTKPQSSPTAKAH